MRIHTIASILGAFALVSALPLAAQTTEATKELAQQEQGAKEIRDQAEGQDIRARMGSVGIAEEQQAKEQYQLLRDASDAYRKVIRDSEDARKREEQIRKSECVAVFPELTETALFFGRKGSNGVATCKTDDGSWSALSFIKLSGTSVGAQLGWEKSSVVFLFTDEEAKQKLIEGDASLGTDLEFAVWQANVGIGTEPSQVVAFSDDHGGKLGVAVSGSSIAAHEEAIDEYYSQRVSHQELLRMAHSRAYSRLGDSFIQMLPS